MELVLRSHENSSDPTWSVIISIGILLVAVLYIIYWIFKYDEWNPDP